MSTVSSPVSCSTVVRRPYRDNIDAQAEREAAAIELFEELTGRPTPLPRVAIARMHAREAAERDLPEPKRLPAYRWVASCRAHRRLQDAPWSHLVFPPTRRLPSENNVVRRLARYVRRQEKLAMLAAMKDRVVSLEEAAELAGLGLRTLQRAAANGKLKASRDFTPTQTNGLGKTGRWVVRLSDLRNLLNRKLKGEPIAA